MLTYFKESGKYYSEGEIDLSNISGDFPLFKIWDSIIADFAAGKYPGLMDSDGYKAFYVLIEVPGHPHDHPKLFIPPQLKVAEETK